MMTRFMPAAVLLAVGAIGGCSESTSPPEAVGSYTAISFVTTGSSGQTNQLLAGSTLEITLHPDLTTSGHLHIAASGGQPGLDADMAGTWRQTGDIVDFSQTADTFVRDMAFRAERTAAFGYHLVGSQVFSGTQINITLAREN